MFINTGKVPNNFLSEKLAVNKINKEWCQQDGPLHSSAYKISKVMNEQLYFDENN